MSLFVFFNCIFQNQLCSSASSIKEQYALPLCPCQHDIQSWLSLARESFGLVTVDHKAAILLHGIVGWTWTKLGGLYGSLCYNESRIPTTNVLNYNFVSNRLIEWTFNNTEAGKSQLGHSLVPVVLFHITDSLHIKRCCKFVLLVRENNKQINDAANHWGSCFNRISITLNLGGCIRTQRLGREGRSWKVHFLYF